MLNLYTWINKDTKTKEEIILKFSKVFNFLNNSGYLMWGNYHNFILTIFTVCIEKIFHKIYELEIYNHKLKYKLFKNDAYKQIHELEENLSNAHEKIQENIKNSNLKIKELELKLKKKIVENVFIKKE